MRVLATLFMACGIAVKASLEEVSVSSYELRQGRPVLTINGRAVPRAAYIDRIMRGDWEERVKAFAASGTRCFGINVPHGGADFFDAAFWTDDGVYPQSDTSFPLPLERQAEIVLRHCPEATLFVVCMSSVPLAWSQKYPDQMQTDEQGRRYREASLASPLYLQGLTQFLRTLVNYCETRPWGDRIVGYYIYPFGEGIMPLVIAGNMFDCSPANETAFKEWLRKRYADDASLAAAWGDPAAKLDTAAVPRDSEWRAKRAAGPATINSVPCGANGALDSNSGVQGSGLFHFIEAANAAPEHDYCRFMRDNFLRWIRTMKGALKSAAAEHGVERVVGFDITKQPLMGWQIQSAFDGIGDGQSFPNILLLSGSFDSGELLDEIDMVVTPADYHARTLGFAYEAEGVSDSMVLRGKPMMIENDARNYVGAGIKDQGAFRDDTEVYAGLLRNAALVASRGLHDYWCNVGSSYFHAPAIHDLTLARLAPALDRLNDWPHRETRDAIAMVIDDTSPLCEDFTSGYQSLAVIWQRVRGLAHCGIPYRIVLLSDLERGLVPSYKAWLFPNLFKVDDNVIELLRRTVLRDGNVAIFGPATGISDGRILSAAPASRLLGLPMELHPRSCVRHVVAQDIPGHAITRELPASHIFGDSLPYGPTLTPCDRAVEECSTATTLGHANLSWFIHRTGLFINELPECRIVWSCAMPLSAEFLRACARYAGCNIWCEENDVVYASDSFVALHTVKSGPRTIRLPRPCRVVDAISGAALPVGDDALLRLELRAPETRAFLLD